MRLGFTEYMDNICSQLYLFFHQPCSPMKKKLKYSLYRWIEREDLKHSKETSRFKSAKKRKTIV